MNPPNIRFDGLPAVPETELAVLRARTNYAFNEFAEQTDVSDLEVCVCRRSGHAGAPEQDRKAPEDFESCFQARKASFSFERVSLPERIRNLMLSAVAAIEHEHLLFAEWGLSEIQAQPRAALLFNGPPGTGKTAAAEGLAAHLGLPILTATTADLESKYLGEGPKRVAAFFTAAREQGALALIDECDTMLASRMTVTQGSERAANSMTSQLLIELEQHQGPVVFATNLLKNVDEAFTTRVLRIDFELPDRATRHEIWKKHFPQKLPLKDVDVNVLADVKGICGRDIRNAVILAASAAARSGRSEISTDDLVEALQQSSPEPAINS